MAKAKKYYDIIVRFPNKEVADAFCGQCSDGFGENYCDFSYSRKKAGTDGTKPEHWERVKDSAPEGTPVFFVSRLFDCGDD